MNGFGNKRRETGKAILVIVIVSGLMFFLGGFALFIGVREIVGARSSRNWPSVDGTVIRSKVRVSESRGTDSSGKSTTTYDYEADIGYRYAVGDGAALQGDRLSFGGLTNRAIAERTVKKYPVGATVKVYYDPGKPEQSVLEPGYSGGMLFMPIMGTVVVGCGLLSAWLIWKFS